MKTSTAIILASVIFLIGIVIYSLSNIYYIDSSTGLIINRMTGDVKEAKIEAPEQNWEDKYSWLDSFEIDKGDFSKVTISGEAIDDSNPYFLKITCTVKNNDSIKHLLSVKAIFYDENNFPILTKESYEIFVAPNGIESVTLTVFDNVESISSYELILIQSENDGEIKFSD